MGRGADSGLDVKAKAGNGAAPGTIPDQRERPWLPLRLHSPPLPLALRPQSSQDTPRSSVVRSSPLGRTGMVLTRQEN